jgi:Glyoxalase-like domain
VISDGSTGIRSGGVDGYEGPGWPDSVAPERHHLDLQVDDMTKAVERCLELGAGKPEFQPGGDRWTVLTDPGRASVLPAPAPGPGRRLPGQTFDGVTFALAALRASASSVAPRDKTAASPPLRSDSQPPSGSAAGAATSPAIQLTAGRSTRHAAVSVT